MTINRKIFRAAIILGLFTFVAKLGSAAKEVVVAQWFGRGDAVDAFLMAMLVPVAVINLSADALSVALIPTYIAVREKGGREAALRLLSSAFLLGLGLVTVLCLLAGLLAPYYLPVLASGFAPSKLALTRQLLYVLLPFSLISGLVIMMTYVLNAHEQFVLPSWSPILVPMAAVVFLLLGGRRWGIYALAAGTVFGVFLQCVTLARGLWVRNVLAVPRWYGGGSSLRKVMAQFLPTLPTGFLILGMGLVDQAMAAMLEPGSVAALGYGLKIVALVNGMAGAALAYAVFPYFSALAAQNDRVGLGRTLNTYVLMCLWFGAVVSSFLYLFSQPLIALPFYHRAFTAADTFIVSRVSALYSLGIPTYMISILGVRVLSCLSLNQVVAAVSFMNFIVNAAMDFVLMKYFGVAGIALSTTVVYLLSAAAVFVALFWRAKISLDKMTLIHICAVGILLLCTIAFGEWSQGRLAYGLLSWSPVLMAALWGVSRRFPYKEMLSTIMRGVSL